MKPTFACIGWIGWIGWLLCSLSPNLTAQEEETESRNYESLPEEIIVIGRDFLELQQMVDAAQDRVYAIFNELNDDDMYDIKCRKIARLGTRIESKVCTPGFLDDATEQEALGFLEGRPYTPPTAVIGYHAPILEQKMRELVLENPEFFEAIDDHRVLREELDAKKSMAFDK